MVLTTRELSPVVVPASTYAQAGSGAVLDTLEGDKLVGLLRQIAQLSEHAAEIFQGPSHLHAPAHSISHRPVYGSPHPLPLP